MEAGVPAPSLQNCCSLSCTPRPLHTGLSILSSVHHQQSSPGLRGGQAHCPRQRRPRQQAKGKCCWYSRCGTSRRMSGKAVLPNARHQTQHKVVGTQHHPCNSPRQGGVLVKTNLQRILPNILEYGAHRHFKFYSKLTALFTGPFLQ